MKPTALKPNEPSVDIEPVELERLATLALGLLKIGAIERLGQLQDYELVTLGKPTALAAYWAKNLAEEPQNRVFFARSCAEAGGPK